MNDAARWSEARELFLDLVELPADSRADELERRTARDPELARWVRDLLRHDTGGKAAPPAERLGPYELVRPLGSGGMGEVFVARRVDGAYEREVAIKRLRRGFASEEIVRRFLRERQTLARLDHEFIVRLLDGGTSGAGEPYLVMELVDGVPADAYSERLDLRGKLQLFQRITEAVGHAHERGFVHRDLKPGNILVRGDGSPRLLDFGIARVGSAEEPARVPGGEPLTRAGMRLFTPEYASPEQVRGETATGQSDVFALGVLLYRFLTGVLPWPASEDLRALETSICDDDPLPPSRARRHATGERIPRDLDAIVLCCLAKRPSDRYASVALLRDDVQAFQDGRPVRARRTGVVFRALRRARRRPVHAVAWSLLVAVLATGVVAWRIRVTDARRRVELRTAIADRIRTADARVTQGELDAAEAEIEAALSALKELAGERVLEAEALSRQAVFASKRGSHDTALARVDRAFGVLASEPAPDPVLVARLLNTRTYALQMRSPGPESLEAAREARDHTLTRVPRGHVLRVDALMGWATELTRQGSDAEALSGFEEALAEARRIDDPDRKVVARALNDLAVALAARGRYGDAGERFREALGILGWIHGESHPSVAVVRYNLGTVFFRDGRVAEAAEEFERSLAAARTARHDVLIGANQHFLARTHLAGGRFTTAEHAAREAVAVRERVGPPGALAESRCVLGLALAKSARIDEARTLLGAVLAGDPRLPLEFEADARHALGAILQDAGEPASARAHLERALELKRALRGPDHADCADLARRLAR